MPNIHVAVDHELTQKEALKRIHTLLKDTKKEYGALVTDLEETWKGNEGTFSFSARGYAISGTIDVSSPTVTLDGEVPLALGFFKGKIEGMLRDRAEKLLR